MTYFTSYHLKLMHQSKYLKIPSWGFCIYFKNIYCLSSAVCWIWFTFSKGGELTSILRGSLGKRALLSIDILLRSFFVGQILSCFIIFVPPTHERTTFAFLIPDEIFKTYIYAHLVSVYFPVLTFKHPLLCHRIMDKSSSTKCLRVISAWQDLELSSLIFIVPWWGIPNKRLVGACYSFLNSAWKLPLWKVGNNACSLILTPSNFLTLHCL